MEMIQVKISVGEITQISWVENKKGVKKGNRLSLKGDPRIWNIEETFQRRASELIHSDWHVGGL